MDTIAIEIIPIKLLAKINEGFDPHRPLKVHAPET